MSFRSWLLFGRLPEEGEGDVDVNSGLHSAYDGKPRLQIAVGTLPPPSLPLSRVIIMARPEKVLKEGQVASVRLWMIIGVGHE